MSKNTKLYVGNLAYSVEATDLETEFGKHGQVTEAKLIRDHDGRSKGFGFVTFETEEDANTALEALNGVELQGRQLKVSVARDKQTTGGPGGGAGRGGFGGGASRGGFGGAGAGGNRDRGGNRDGGSRDGGSRGGW